MKQVAVYSGTFDPIHLGHEWLVDYCLNERRFDEVIILVEPRPRRKESVSPLRDRIAMVTSRFIDEPRVSVNPFECASDQFTLAETLGRIKEYTGEADISLVMGGDVFEYVSYWQGIADLLSELSFVVALRTEDDGEIAVAVMSDPLAGATVHLVVSPYPLVSSTHARREIAVEGASEKVAENVLEYAVDNELYRED